MKGDEGIKENRIIISEPYFQRTSQTTILIPLSPFISLSPEIEIVLL